MRISEVPGDRALEVMATIAEAVGECSKDEALVGLMRGEGDAAEKAAAVAPALLRGHGEAVYRVLASIEGETPEAYKAGRRLPQVLRDLMDVLTDEELLDFLPSASPTQTGSGSE